MTQNFQSDILSADLDPVDTAAEVGLTVEIPKQSTTLLYSTQAETFLFTLTADGPYTLRYLTIQAEAHGLKPITTWTLYEMHNNAIDFTKPIGTSEEHEGNLFRIRLYSSRSAAYVGEAGEQNFVLVASVLRDPVSTEPASLTFSLPSTLPPTLNWAWLPGEHLEAWLNVTESLDVLEVAGLPTDAVQKN